MPPPAATSPATPQEGGAIAGGFVTTDVAPGTEQTATTAVAGVWDGFFATSEEAASSEPDSEPGDPQDNTTKDLPL
jgi:hypothetical protein